MVKLAGYSGQEIVKALQRSDKLSLQTTKKNHEVSRFLLKDQLKLAGISKDEFLRLLKKKKKR